MITFVDCTKHFQVAFSTFIAIIMLKQISTNLDFSLIELAHHFPRVLELNIGIDVM